jgi:putative addiction module component (TIGR02574 family)
MRDAPPLPPPGFDDLSVEEQIEYVSSLWDRIASQPETVPVPDWHWKIIEERLAAHEVPGKRADVGIGPPEEDD